MRLFALILLFWVNFGILADVSHPLVYRWKHYMELSKDEVYQILALRHDVFAMELGIKYGEKFDVDARSWHLLGYLDNNLVGYVRVLPAGVTYPEMSFGRVAIAKNYRGRGLGKSLLKECLKWIALTFPTQPIRISALHNLKKFYENFGFITTGEPYFSDNIFQIEMRREY